MHEEGDGDGVGRPGGGRRWTFVTNHFLVLQQIAQDPSTRMIDVAERLGISERSVQMVVADLVADGYLAKTRVGRRNRYEVAASMPLRHLETQHRGIGELLALLRSSSSRTEPTGS